MISAMVKYRATNGMREALNDAMDVQGGSGICLGPRNLLGRAYQAIPISITVEGANILTRSLIIFGQGAIRAHPWLLKEMDAARTPRPDARKAFDKALFSHVGHIISNGVRSWMLGVTLGRAGDRARTRFGARLAVQAIEGHVVVVPGVHLGWAWHFGG